MPEKKEKAQKPKERRKEVEKTEKLKDIPKANDSDSEVCFSLFLLFFFLFIQFAYSQFAAHIDVFLFLSVFSSPVTSYTESFLGIAIHYNVYTFLQYCLKFRFI